MPVVAYQSMNADEFLAGAEGYDGRCELQDGELIVLSPESSSHLTTKSRAAIALTNAIARARATYEVLPDGAAVRISARTVFKPDATVYRGGRVSANNVALGDPVLALEVRSPFTAARDHLVKVEGYFSLPSLIHYLIVDSDEPWVICHSRGPDGVIETRFLREGTINLEPLGLEVRAADLFPMD